MAVTSLWRVHGNLNNVILYTENKDKTEVIKTNNDDRDPEKLLSDLFNYAARDDATLVKKYVYGINCDPENAVEEMMNVKKHFGKLGGVTAYHGYLSFTKGEVDADTAHEIGIRLAEKCWGEKYQVVVCTHLDKESHLHCHFVINTVSFIDGIKFHRTKSDYAQMRNEADALCREYGLSVVEYPNNRRQNYEQYVSEKNGKLTNSAIIKSDMDVCMNAARTYDEFIKLMSKKGYTFDLSGKHEKITHPDFARPRRLITLGKEYTIGCIKETIRRNWQFEKEEYLPQDETDKLFNEKYEDEYEEEYDSLLSDRTMPHLRYLYDRYTFEMTNWIDRKQYNKYKLYLIKDDIRKFNRFAEEQDVLLYNHIDTGTDLLNFISTCDNELKQFEEARKKLRTKLKSAENSGDEKLASELRSNISVVTQAMKKVRRDKKVCENIRDRAPEIAKKIRDVDAVNEKIRREKELEKTRAEKTTMQRSRYGYDR